MKSISSSNPKDKLIFALDAAGYEEALSWINLLSGHVGMFKVGKELFTSVGPKIIETIKQRESKVFLDLKFHDIPNTVARAAEAAVALNVDMFNVHAAGGSRMMRETVDAVAACAGKRGIKMPVVLAVTVLTSLNNSDLQEIGFEKTTDELVTHLAKLAHLAGMTGVVASPRDIAAIRSACGKDFVIVTPGIRSADEPVKDDQKRTLSAFEAIQSGADYIVVGRPIRNAPGPLTACSRIVDEIACGLASREGT
ncbi:MAG TPA: orotidine-5'-phosphate decarboxylase [Smithellaceae bacterium]|jgi:orotidine-5'-phosphate decarboxylase|nr:orotidine-5'-phosphate decarboxylase [Smithellaceae bacterium]HPL67363.1 orotidine-5'-phosphate decarboxylase [Smithellaceae bacterium]